MLLLLFVVVYWGGVIEYHKFNKLNKELMLYFIYTMVNG